MINNKNRWIDYSIVGLKDRHLNGDEEKMKLKIYKVYRVREKKQTINTTIDWILFHRTRWHFGSKSHLIHPHTHTHIHTLFDVGIVCREAFFFYIFVWYFKHLKDYAEHVRNNNYDVWKGFSNIQRVIVDQQINCNNNNKPKHFSNVWHFS